MAEIALPDGFAARALVPDEDAQTVTDLCNAAANAEYGEPELDVQIVRESYKSPGFNPKTDALLVFDSEDRAVAVVEYYDNSADHVAPFVYLRVRPDHLEAGIGEALLEWAEERGYATVPLAAPDLRVALHANAAGANELMQRIFEQSGWRQERIFWEMEIELTQPPDVPELAAGITIRSAVAGVDEPKIHAAEIDSFADHYGYLPRTFETWLQMATQLYDYDPSLWFLAEDSPEVAGISLCQAERPGSPDAGYVGILGVRRKWRGKGLGLALLRHSFAELYRRGKRRVRLGVDSQSLTGATRLYERAGMHVVRDARAYERVLRDGKELRPT